MVLTVTIVEGYLNLGFISATSDKSCNVVASLQGVNAPPQPDADCVHNCRLAGTIVTEEDVETRQGSDGCVGVVHEVHHPNRKDLNITLYDC